MEKVPRLLRNKIVQHFVFWLFVLFFQVTRSNHNFVNFSLEILYKLLFEHILLLPVLMAASYFTAYCLFPNFFFKKQYFKFSFFLVISATIFIFSMRAILFFIVFPKIYPAINKSFPGFMQFNIIQHLFYTYTTVAVMVMIKVTRQWNVTQKKQELLVQQNLKSELTLLRSQISPHFLFNTLNNIAYLTKKDPELSYFSIVKLSEMLRYLLYESGNEKVLLQNEINCLKNYIDLQIMRLQKPDFVKFVVTGSPENKFIPPMLFIPFVENAFKHGNKETESTGIDISLQIFEKHLEFKVTNFLNQNKLIDLPQASGIGIPNVKRRLDLLYANQPLLSIVNDGSLFKVKLVVPF